jgi:hypothetical protein
MSNLVYLLIDLPVFTTGRRSFAFTQTLVTARKLVEARESGDVALVAQLEQALEHEAQTLQMEAAWRRSRSTSAARGEATVRDAEVDRIIGAIFSLLESAMAVKDDSDEYKAARELHGQLFPGGVAPLVQLAHEDQLAANDGLMLALTTTHKGATQTLNLGRYVEALGRANDAFRGELGKQPVPEISFDTVQAARDRGNLNLRMAVARILGASTDLTPEAEAERGSLLAPILEQVRRIRAGRRGRRRVVDIDPKTGEDLPLGPSGPTDDEE